MPSGAVGARSSPSAVSARTGAWRLRSTLANTASRPRWRSSTSRSMTTSEPSSPGSRPRARASIAPTRSDAPWRCCPGCSPATPAVAGRRTCCRPVAPRRSGRSATSRRRWRSPLRSRTARCRSRRTSSSRSAPAAPRPAWRSASRSPACAAAWSGSWSTISSASTHPCFARLARRTAALLERRGARLGQLQLEPGMLDLTRDQIGAGYGHPTEAAGQRRRPCRRRGALARSRLHREGDGRPAGAARGEAARRSGAVRAHRRAALKKLLPGRRDPMRKLILHMGISIDGFVAATDGAHDWGYSGEDEAVKRWKLDSLWNAGAHSDGPRHLRRHGRRLAGLEQRLRRADERDPQGRLLQDPRAARLAPRRGSPPASWMPRSRR